MAGMDSVSGLFEQIVSSVWLAGPLLLMLIVALIFCGVIWMFYTRRGIFYWWGAIRAPLIITKEGDMPTVLPGGDRFRMTKEKQGTQAITYFESKQYGDKFVGDHLTSYISYRGKQGAFLPLFRAKKNVWTRIDFKDVEELTEGAPRPEDVEDAMQGFAIMDSGNEAFLGKGLLEQLLPYLIIGGAFVFATIIMLIMVQFLSASLNTHVSALTASTDALIRLVNATTGCHATPTPIAPLG